MLGHHLALDRDKALAEKRVQDFAFQPGQFGRAASAWPGHGHIYVERNPPGADHHHAVRKSDGLRHVMRHQHRGEFFGKSIKLVEERSCEFAENTDSFFGRERRITLVVARCRPGRNAAGYGNAATCGDRRTYSLQTARAGNLPGRKTLAPPVEPPHTNRLRNSLGSAFSQRLKSRTSQSRPVRRFRETLNRFSVDRRAARPF